MEDRIAENKTSWEHQDKKGTAERIYSWEIIFQIHALRFRNKNIEHYSFFWKKSIFLDLLNNSKE